MKKLHFETEINSPAQKVWQALWEDKNYRLWTAAFEAGSHAESDWKEGSSIKFLGPSGDGMYSVIEKKIENKQMTFRHLGSIKDGKQIPETDWTNSIEEYILEENNGTTNLKVSVDVVESYIDIFKESFKKALQIVKEISENK
ncbi:SRPBCC family protein [Aequorivita echinoideorum]|uniref:SRPBCC domain-containing protein n=1 Tax=Aequorivita echinoideorum TaxID=1549647 RepID=A0ABS5S4T5_9FLAO|nr:SRPBCC domain-containing protein [Aequorivita echinoideorum]MBT0608199.1 SRPBCC domain-containing protein [Aequorivita echinoideorum]